MPPKKRRNKQKSKEQKEIIEHARDNAEIEKKVGLSSASELDKLFSGKGRITGETVKALMTGLLKRRNIQYVGVGLTGLIAIVMLFGGLVSLSYLTANNASNHGLITNVANNALPQIFFFLFIGVAGVSFGSKEIDVKTGAGLTALIAGVCFFIYGSIMYSKSTSVLWSTCPSMGQPGTRLVTFAKEYAYGNITFNPIDPLNPNGLAPYFTSSDFDKVTFYIMSEYMCHQGDWFQFFWWLTLFSDIMAAVIFILLAFDLYYHYKELNSLVSFVEKKYNISIRKGKKDDVELDENAEDEEEGEGEEESDDE